MCDAAKFLLNMAFRTEEYPTLDRIPSIYNPLHSYALAKGDLKQYQQQYADIYFLRLAKLKPAVEELASQAWEEFEVCGRHTRPNKAIPDTHYVR